MHRLHADVDQVFLYDMDKTLKDYIDRTQKRLNEDKDKPMSHNPNQYLIVPENTEEEDKPQNPHGQH